MRANPKKGFATAINKDVHVEGGKPVLRFATLATIVMATGATVLAPVERAKSQPSVNAKTGEWRYLNSDPGATRYSPLDQITKDNFKDLKLAWRWKPAI